MFSMRNAFGYQIPSAHTLDSEESSVHDFDDLGTTIHHADQPAIEKAFARLFSTQDGQLVLSHLQSITFQRALGPDAPDTQLRYLEGQRAMIATIMRLIRTGRIPPHH